MRTFLLALAVAFVPSLAAARTVLPEDLAQLHDLSSAAISHDGRIVAFVDTRIDARANTYRSSIWVVDADGSSPARQLTQGESDNDPQWSPDDRTLAFVRTHDDKPQIYRISLSGGEAERLTGLEGGAVAPRWSHDGTKIAFVSVVKDDSGRADVDWHALGITPTAAQKTSDVRHIDVQHFEDNGRGETYDRHAHLWVMNADGSGARALTSGHRWSERDAAWSPDDRTLAYVTLRRDDPDLVANDVYTIPSAGGTAARVPLPHKSATTPVWLHESVRFLYFTGDANDPAAYAGVSSAASDGGGDRTVVEQNREPFGDAVLTDAREGGAGCGPLVEPHDRWFVALVSVPGGTELRRYDAATGNAEKLLGNGDEIVDCSMSADGSRIAFTRSDFTHPAEVGVLDVAAGTTHMLTTFNAHYLAETPLASAEPFTVKDEAGFDVHAWIVRPPNAVAGRRYPTLLEIHGGPETEFGNSFFHEFQMLAGRGYNVVFADPRGSVGFGYPFEAALSKNWGDPMFRDEMAVMDAVVARPDVDPNRLGVLGGSYGGYATLWIVGHTHRFKSAVAERVASNLETLQLASDFAGGVSAQYSWGNAWDHEATYWRQSPLAYVANVTTPLLMIHSDRDIRTPIDQTLQEFEALKILGRTVTYVEFPRENHDLNRTGEPLHRIERLHVIEDWLGASLHP